MEKEIRITLRLPEKLHQKVSGLAAQEVRSLNGQIVAILQNHFEKSEAPKEKKQSDR